MPENSSPLVPFKSEGSKAADRYFNPSKLWEGKKVCEKGLAALTIVSYMTIITPIAMGIFKLTAAIYDSYKNHQLNGSVQSIGNIEKASVIANQALHNTNPISLNGLIEYLRNHPGKQKFNDDEGTEYIIDTDRNNPANPHDFVNGNISIEIKPPNELSLLVTINTSNNHIRYARNDGSHDEARDGPLAAKSLIKLSKTFPDHNRNNTNTATEMMPAKPHLPISQTDPIPPPASTRAAHEVSLTEPTPYSLNAQIVRVNKNFDTAKVNLVNGIPKLEAGTYVNFGLNELNYLLRGLVHF